MILLFIKKEQQKIKKAAEEKERVRRLQAQEESLSSPIGGAARKGGRVTGLTQG